ncbi:zinc finger BED domain-containing protein DAYSLEEPER [Daphnia magna]|nr:zinc finger BED domain-containing protein DAYSLEEPER [Daphnia magna]
MAATFLDPRLKMQYFIDNGWDCGGESRDAFQPLDENLITGRVMPAIQFVWKNYKQIPTVQTMNIKAMEKSNSSKNVTSSVSTGSGKRPAFDHSYIANVLSKNSSVERFEIDEMGEYEVERTEPADCDPRAVYTYWAKRSCRWPRLGHMAKEILSIPATSASSERAFSVGKDVFGIARMSLKAETVEALVCLRSWYRLGIIVEMDVQPFLDENADGQFMEEYSDSE